jgi:hypothetical protein
MKVKIIREDGFPLDGQIIAAGEEIELAGARLDAALRFKEVEAVKEEAPAPKKK